MPEDNEVERTGSAMVTMFASTATMNELRVVTERIIQLAGCFSVFASEVAIKPRPLPYPATYFTVQLSLVRFVEQPPCSDQAARPSPAVDLDCCARHDPAARLRGEIYVRPSDIHGHRGDSQGVPLLHVLSDVFKGRKT